MGILKQDIYSSTVLPEYFVLEKCGLE